MSRIRTIKPEFWTHERIVTLPFEARLMFLGMWNFCDDDGYLSDEPDSIRLQVLPADRVDAWGIIDLLVAAGLLDRLTVGDSYLLHIKGFHKHQQISHKTPTKYPVSSGKKRIIPAHVRREIALKYGCTPGGLHDATCYFCGAYGKIWWSTLSDGRPSSWVAFSELEIDHLDPEFLGGPTTTENLVLSCRYCNRSRGTKRALEFMFDSDKIRKLPENSRLLRPEGKGIEGKGTIPYKDSLNETFVQKTDLSKKRTTRKKPDLSSAEFEKFWEVYGYKLARKRAEAAFAKAVKIAPLEKILTAVETYHRTRPSWQATALAASWLNGERWNDLPAANGEDKAAVKSPAELWAEFWPQRLEAIKDAGFTDKQIAVEEQRCRASIGVQSG